MNLIKGCLNNLTAYLIVPIVSAVLTITFPSTSEAGVCGRLNARPKCVDSKDIKDNDVKAIDLKDEAGADFIEGISEVALNGAVQIIASIQITAPNAGLVIANTSGWFDFITDQNSVACGLSRDGSLPKSPIIQEDHPYDPNTSDDDRAFALTRGFQVNAGTSTIYLVCQSRVPSGIVYDVAMTAMYFPTKY